MSSGYGRTSLILSLVMLFIGVLVIIDGVTKGEPGLNVEIALGSVLIVYAIARYWLYKPRTR